MRGVISDRLRGLFGQDVSDWPSARVPDEIADMPESWYQGIELGEIPFDAMDQARRGEVKG